MGSGTQLTKAPFKCAEGAHQGAVESGCFFTIGCHKAFQKLRTTLMENGGSGMAIIDGNYAIGCSEHIFPGLHIFGNDLKEVGLQLHPAKSQYYIAEAFRNDEWD